jgi:pimeloyl-ACP methyl ester carboxylesterase
MPSSNASSHRDEYVDHAGLSLAVRDHGGAGSPLILLHGGGRTLADWGLVVPHLLAHHRVVAVDLRNHGQSGDGVWEWDRVVGDVAAVADAYHLQRPVVIGHSLGGMVAAHGAAYWPGGAAAVNIDGHGPGRPEQYDGLAPELVRARLAELDDLARRGSPPAELTTELLEAIADSQARMAEQHGFPPEIVVEGWRRSLTPLGDGRYTVRPTRQASADQAAAVNEVDLLGVYRASRRPLLIYRTTRTELLAPQLELPGWVPELLAAYHRGLLRDLRQLAGEHPAVTVQTMDAGHWPLFEQPERLAASLEDFLATHVPAARGAPTVASNDAR